MNGLRPLSALTPDEKDWVGRFLGTEGTLPLYFDTALEDLARGIDNRLVLIGARQQGAILGITFADLEAFTLVGALDRTEWASACSRRMPAELHVPGALAEQVRPSLGARLISEHAMRIETCTIGSRATDQVCRRMSPNDADALAPFYRAHNPRNVFSPWMLEHPFIAIVEGNEIVSAAGVLALSRKVGWALIGNFLTRPDRRGRGLARRVGETLLAALATMGIRHAALATTEENLAARRVYARLGFSLAERWVEFDLSGIKILN